MVTRRDGRKPQVNIEYDSDLTIVDPTETTRLLGGGAEENGNRAVVKSTSKGGWDGLADFEGLPWWRRPSVSCSTSSLDYLAPLT